MLSDIFSYQKAVFDIITCYRCQDVLKRKEYVTLVDSVRENGGDVRIFSSMHVSGERKYYVKVINDKSSTVCITQVITVRL